jgi:endoglucanase
MGSERRERRVSIFLLRGLVTLGLGLGELSFSGFEELNTDERTRVSAGNTALSALIDPENKIIYEMHQYLDSDGSGTSDTCVSSTIGSERLAAATAWLKSSGTKAILGEFAGGANSVCESAVTDMLTYIGGNTDVWTGALWWGGGPWWGDYIFSMEPPSGIAYEDVLPLMLPLI